MATGGRDYSSDDESLHSVESRRKKPKAFISSDSDEDDNDFEVKPRKNVKPLDESEDSDHNYSKSSFSREAAFCSNEAELSSANDLSDNEQSDKCAICLSKFSGQDIATPETCDHMFCRECLQQWAKNVNTCPIDRLKFNLILIHRHKEEKIIKRIYVNSTESPCLSESDNESVIQYENVFSCAFCAERDYQERLMPCTECRKRYHLECLIRPPERVPHTRLCPNCATTLHVKRFKVSRRWMGLDDPCTYSDSRSTPFSHHLYHGGLMRLRQKTHELIRRLKRRRRMITSSESSDDDIEPSGGIALRLYQEELRSNPPIFQKRARMPHRSQSRILVSATASATSNSGLYSVDSDENEPRYSSNDGELLHRQPSSSSRNNSLHQRATKIVISAHPPNFDVVGSIMQSQTLLHRPDVLTLQRDGTVLSNLDVSPSSSGVGATATSSSTISSDEQNEGEAPILQSSNSNTRPVMPCAEGVPYKQIPMNPTQNANSKYRETPRDNYTCSSSTTSREPSVEFNNVSISSRNALERSGNEKYNNDNSCSVINKGFCSSSSADDVKKISNCKESNKAHHSEDEVDIYSDIESVGDDEGASNAIEGVNDRLESMKLPYKPDQSPSSNPEAASDSSDNELVIDEDMAVDDEGESHKEHFHINNSKDKSEVNENEQVNESEESNSSYSGNFNQEQAGSETPDVQDNCSYVDSRSIGDSQLGEESSQETFQDSGGNEGYKNESECDESKHGSEYDENKNGSEYEEEKNASGDEEEKNESDDEERNRSDDEDKNESVGEDKNLSECEDQESDMDVQVCEDNSVDSYKKSPRAGTPCSTVSLSKPYDEEMKQESLEDQCDDSVSSENQEYCDSESRKNEEAADVSSIQENENTHDSFSQTGDNENYQNENNSNFSFASSQNNMSEAEEATDSNADVSQTFSEGDKREADEVCNDVDMKSEYHDDEEGNDNVDISENASTPCLDENIDGQIENSPIHNENLESACTDSKSNTPEIIDSNVKTSDEYEMVENDKVNEHASEEQHVSNSENAVDLGIEDISEAGSGDLDDDFADENMSFSDANKQSYNDCEREDNSNHVYNVDDDQNPKLNSKHIGESKYKTSPHSNDSFDDREEGEIVEERPVCRPDHKKGAKYEHYHDENEEYSDLAKRVNISALPRIPKIKRNREKDSVPEELPVENKRTSVLGRVDLGGGDIGWKRLSKHTRERSYRDGRLKEDRVMYRERESRKKEKKFSSDSDWRSGNKSSRRDDSKKQDSEKLRSEYDSRSRKSDKKDNKLTDWDYSDRDKHSRSHKERHKDKHKDKQKDKVDKGKYDKNNKYSKDDSKYSRDKVKDDEHYDRELRFDKEQRFERIVYEKGKFKEKDHKIKHKDRKSDSKSSKDHSREKHKHCHSADHFSDKQRGREVRKIDDKLKIVVEQKEGKKEKSKHKDKKDSKYEKKQIHHHEHRKKEVERSPYTEHASIESKEIFAKGDSIIINVSFNRTTSPKDTNIENTDSNFKDRKNIEEFELDDAVGAGDKNKSKYSLIDKNKSVLDAPITKRPATPPERTNQVLSVSECYWQEGEDSDANNSRSSGKSVEEITIEDENETVESANAFEEDNFSNSCNSTEQPESLTATKESVSGNEEASEKVDKVDSSFSKETEIIVPPKRRSPRSPSPPSPADNDSYDPCEPTRSPSPPPMPPAPPLPTGNPKPPPSPELPPLPLEPEPIDNVREETLIHKQNISEFISVSSVVASNASQAVSANTQTSVANPISMPSMLLPPPSFLSHTSTATNGLHTLSSLIPSNFNFQVNNHPMFQPNHVQQIIRNIVPNQMHAGTAIPPPPNPPSLPHMGSVPPPPPPPSAMALISPVRHPQMTIRPALTANSLLQNLTMGHPVNMSQMQMAHLHHIPPNFSNPISSHQSSMIPSQNQSVGLPVSIQNQPISRVVLTQNQLLNHTLAMQNQNNLNNKHQSNALNVMSHQPLSNSTPIKSDKITTAEKMEVIDMDVDSPYSPGDSPSMDSVCDYSPTCSPLPSTPKSKDIFDSLLPTDYNRTSDRKTQDFSTKAEKSKRSDSKSDTPTKRAKLDHKSDSSKVRHSVRMQIADKAKARRERIEKRLDDSQLKILDELPSSAVEMQVKEKFLKKLNRQERVVEEVKLVLKPYYKTRDVTKEEYKDILRRSVPKICHNKSGEINPLKVKTLVESYIRKIKHSRKRSDKKKSRLS